MRIIAGRWKGRRLRSPSGRDVRPTQDRVKEAWMSMIGPAVEDARVLDLFAGSGSLGLECLSRGAAHVVFVERSGPVVDVLRKNLELLGVMEDRRGRAGEARIVRNDVGRFLDGLSPDDERFDLALGDPPYGTGEASRLLERFVEAPFSDEIWVEHSTREALQGYPGTESRRYGDTTLTWIRAPEGTTRSEGPSG